MQEILDWISRTGLSNIVWITDLDRTIIDHDRFTGTTVPPTGLADTLERLDRRAGGLYIVTGRDLTSVDKLFPANRFRASTGYHSVVRFDPDAKPVSIIPVPEWNIIEARLEELTRTHPKLFLKTMDHYRGLQYFRLPEEEQAAVRDSLIWPMQNLVEEMNAKSGKPYLELADCDGALEIVPVGSSKGPAIGDIQSHASARSQKPIVPIYFGDNTGDIAPGLAAQAYGGIFVAVGDDPEVNAVADFHLPDPAAARSLFSHVAGFNPPLFPLPQPGL